MLLQSYAVEYGVPTVIARLAQTFGPGVPVSDNRVFMQFTKSALKHEDIVLHTKGDSMSNYCYITDALTGILALMRRAKLARPIMYVMMKRLALLLALLISGNTCK